MQKEDKSKEVEKEVEKKEEVVDEKKSGKEIDGGDEGAGKDKSSDGCGRSEAKGKEKKEVETSEQDSGEDTPVKEKKEKGSTRHKKELAKKDEEIKDLKDRLVRQMAEFDNFRKRNEKEKATRFDDGERYILEKLLPVIDNFERGLAAVPDDAKDDPYVAGMEAIYKQLDTTLKEAGVEPIVALGEEFDPNFHNAVMHVEDENAKDGEIVEELQKGYTFKDTVLRYSMVKVAN